MLPGVPVVHVAIPIDQLEGLSLPADVVGKSIDLDPTETLRFALRLQPRAERIVIVLGAAPRDRIWEQRLRKAVAQLEGAPRGRVPRRVADRCRPATAWCIVQGYDRLHAGLFPSTAPVRWERRASRPNSSASASAAPAYGPFDTFIGTGIVGGYMAPFDDQATQAGALVVRLLNGTPPTAIAPSSFVNVPVVDWRALRRWRIDEQLLPANADVRFREPTTWDNHWREISLAIAILVLQAGLIAALLIQRRSRLRTAAALAESEQQMTLAAHAARLSTWVWDVTRDKLHSSARLRHRHAQPKDMPDAVRAGPRSRASRGSRRGRPRRAAMR